LIGCEIIAIDEPKAERTTVRKLQSKKIDRHLVYIEERTQEYLAELAKMIYRIIALQSLRLQKNRAIKKNKYFRRKTKGSGQPQISTTDQDGAPISSRVVVEISYNIKQQWIISII
jgi:hypothetical protein